MRLFIDIDGVLARPDEVAIARLCNEEWQLGVDEERLCQCKTLDDFQALPELIARREEREVAAFDFALGWMRFTPRALLADIVLGDAVSGGERLVQLGTISYLTARYSMSEQWHPVGIAQGTQTWLEEHRFVNPCNAYGMRNEMSLSHQLAQDLLSSYDPLSPEPNSIGKQQRGG